MKTLQTKLMALAAGAVIAASFGTAAKADAPTFTFTPTAITGPATPFIANNFSGTSSELLTITSSTTVSGSGWVNIGQFNCSAPNPPCTSGNLNAARTGLGVNYGLYILFNLTDTLTSGTIGQPGSAYTLNSLNFTIVADADNDASFTDAQAMPTVVNATVTDADPVVLAAGSLMNGTAGIGLNGLAANLNSVESFLLCTGNNTGSIGSQNVTGGPLASQCTSGEGRAAFSAPPVFFQIAFDGFTCTGLDPNCVTTNGGNKIAVNDAVGTIDFGIVPEPASLALFGTGALALGWFTRRRQNKLPS